MMRREQLADEIRDSLAWVGFHLSDMRNPRGLAFDIVARRGDTLLLIKVLQNVDAFCKSNADELRLVAQTLDGAPLVVGERSGGGDLEEGVIYNRFGIPILSKETFIDFFEEGLPPLISSAPGGLYVRIDGKALRRTREERGISLGTLAEVAGVSRRTIQMYLEGMSATIDIALRLEEFLKESLVLPVDLFTHAKVTGRTFASWDEFEEFEQDIFRRLQSLGYEVLPTIHCPFEAVTQDREFVMLTGVGGKETAIEKKAEIVSDISRIVEKDAVIFVERRGTRLSIEGTPIVGRDELRKIRGREEIKTLIAERKE